MPHDDRSKSSKRIATSIHTPVPSGRSDLADDGAIGVSSPSMRQVMLIAARVAPLDSTVLITGESGVGKERLARWLHAASGRARGPCVAVNCGAFADTLLESELFGHVRGAFTGALQDRVGVFEAAHGGTLFLDEIGEMSPAMQVTLLRALQEREVRRLGENRVRRIDVRLIAATNRDLAHEIADRRFREDLYHRLNVIDLHVPPLRERPEDLRALADAFLTEAATRLRRPIVAYAPPALDRLLQYPWPGNIRELAHAIERACAVASSSRIEVEDLPSAVRHAPLASERAAAIRPLQAREQEHLLAVLERHHGNRRRTAAELRISLSTLKRKLRAYRRFGYSDLVSAFESFCIRRAPAECRETNFQDLFDAQRAFKSSSNVDILQDLSPDELLVLRRTFQKRHAHVHNGGIIGERYTKKMPEDASLLGQRAQLSIEEFEAAAKSLRPVVDRLARRR